LAAVSPPTPAAPRTAPWTILEVLNWTTTRFAERSLPSPRLDAELLAAHAFGLARIQLYAQFDRPLSADELGRFRELVKRRQAGEPVAYIVGRKEFWSLDLAVDRRVLIPRPDTETAVEAALALLPADAPVRVCDVGTGSGAIALAIKKERPQATVVAIDLSADALAVASENAQRLGLAVEFRHGDLLAPLAAEQGVGAFDVIAANLPYVPRAEVPGLAPEVQAEPLLALDGGDDGLDLVRRLAAAAAAQLRPGGALVLEIGAGQAPATRAICEQGGFVRVAAHKDLGGIERVVVAHRPEGA
jgi:release factor glutamine methyltransferase